MFSLLSLWMKFYRVTNWMKPLQKYFPVALLVMLYLVTSSNFWSMNKFISYIVRPIKWNLNEQYSRLGNSCFWSLYKTMKKQDFIINIIIFIIIIITIVINITIIIILIMTTQVGNHFWGGFTCSYRLKQLPKTGRRLQGQLSYLFPPSTVCTWLPNTQQLMKPQSAKNK